MMTPRLVPGSPRRTTGDVRIRRVCHGAEYAYLTIQVGFNDSANQWLHIRELLQAFGQHQQHVGCILQITSCIRVKTF